MSNVPGWWPMVLLVLAAFRVTRLIGWDDITEPWRQRLVKKHPKGWRPKLITCPWCIGWWVGLAWWAAWLIENKWTLVAATPWAISAGVGLIAKNLDP